MIRQAAGGECLASIRQEFQITGLEIIEEIHTSGLADQS